MTQSKSKVLEILNSESFDGMLDIFDVIASHIKKRNLKEDGAPSTSGYHFLERIKVNYIEGVEDEDPSTDYASAILIIDAPLVKNESEESRRTRTKEIKKDWFPVIGSHNVRTARELLKIFVKSASDEAINKFLEKVELRKRDRV